MDVLCTHKKFRSREKTSEDSPASTDRRLRGGQSLLPETLCLCCRPSAFEAGALTFSHLRIMTLTPTPLIFAVQPGAYLNALYSQGAGANTSTKGKE